MTQTAAPSLPRSRSLLAIALLLTAVIVLRFVFRYLPHYLAYTPESYGPGFWPRRVGLVLHLLGGTIAIVVGVVQLWTGERRFQMAWHRWLGTAYVSAVAVGSAAGYYLVLTIEGMSFTYRSGLFVLTTAWVITTAMAYLAIKGGATAQHREWMIRSYIVTFGFVLFRLLDEVGPAMGLTDPIVRADTGAWMAWALPLLLAEPVIQWRKLRRSLG